MPPPEPSVSFNATIGTPTLDMSHNRFGSGALLEDVLEQVPDVERLDLSNTDLDDLSPLKSLEHLKVLYLIDTEVEDLAPIADITTLEILIISDTLVHDLGPLRRLCNLSWLAMERNSVDSLWPLSHTKSLRVLDLRRALIRGNQFVALHDLADLERVDARSIHIPLSEVQRLREALPNCDVITHQMPEPSGDMTQAEFDEAYQNARMDPQPPERSGMQIYGMDASIHVDAAGEVTRYSNGVRIRPPEDRDDIPEPEPASQPEESKTQQMPKAGEPRRKLKR